jgi:dihydrolipoamide dehydrogenase
MEPSYDVVVIGGGPGGYVSAIRAGQLGFKTACVDANEIFGGTCLRVGCIPSKAMLESSHQYLNAKEGMKQHGIIIKGDIEFDLAAMQRRKSRVVQTFGRGVAGLLKKNSVDAIQGVATIKAPGQVLVTTAEGERLLRATNIIIATGSTPSSLPGVTLDGDRIGTSTEALAYEEVPKHLVVIGAGVIGLELGSVWARLGAKVTVLEYLDRILPGLDLEIAKTAQKIFSKQGLKFQLGAQVQGVQVVGDECQISVAGSSEPILCDRVLMSVGRRPYTDGLGLDEIGVARDKRGFISIDHHFQTNVPGVYAIGDVVGGAMLAHKAEEEGIACVEILKTGAGHVDYNTVPGVIYTEPEVGTVGKSEEQLVAEGIPFKVGKFPFAANSRARAVGDSEGLVKILAHQETDRILGVHIIGPHAGELLSEAVVAMSFGASSEDLARICHSHPTLSEATKEAALAVDGRAIHT